MAESAKTHPSFEARVTARLDQLERGMKGVEGLSLGTLAAVALLAVLVGLSTKILLEAMEGGK